MLDAMFTRWRDETDFGDSFKIADPIERLCFIELGGDIEVAIGQALFDERVQRPADRGAVSARTPA